MQRFCVSLPYVSNRRQAGPQDQGIPFNCFDVDVVMSYQWHSSGT